MKLKITKKWLIIAAAAGVFMIAISVLIPQQSGTKTETVTYYSEKLEEKVASLIGCVDGIENVSVMVTLDCSSEYVYAKNKDDSGEKSASDYVVISGKGGGESTVQLKEIYPKVRGVAVVCTGGDTPLVQAKITNILSSSLGIPSSRITVCG